MKTKNIRKGLHWMALFAVGLGTVGSAAGQTILIDFGNASSWRGLTAPSPDSKGHYWTSVWSGAYYSDLLDIDGNPTAVDFGFSIPGGTDSYNGPAGVTSNPPTPAEIAATDIDASALGNLGIIEAVIDFYDSSSLEIQGLDPTKTYNLIFFGSHKYSDDDTTVYAVYTDGTYTSMADSVTLKIADAPNSPQHNRDRVAVMADVEPQAGNILYVRFFGANGHLGYLNCMQIEEAPPVKARHPIPPDGAKGVPVTTHLTWTAPPSYTPVKYVLRFRMSDSSDPNWLVVDPAVDLALDIDPATTEAAVPIALEHNTTYEWKVSSFKADDPNEFEGPVWSFTTAPELQVNAGPNIITWLEDGWAAVTLNGSITYHAALSRVLWSVVSAPGGAEVVLEEESSEITEASFNAPGTYVLKLWAKDDSVPLENEDTVEIRVFADACLAAQANPAGYTPLPHDANNDCREDLQDFAQFAADWLKDLALTENIEY